jgi:prolipoprotein diacylglyceryltransferase
MGQILSLPMVLLGLILVYWARPARPLDAKP